MTQALLTMALLTMALLTMAALAIWLMLLTSRSYTYYYLLTTCYMSLTTHYSLPTPTLLTAQEFDLPDVLRLWDSLLSDSRRFLQVAAYLLPSLPTPTPNPNPTPTPNQEGAFDFLLYVGATMVICMRDEILEHNVRSSSTQP